MKKILKIMIGSIAGIFLALIIIGALSSNTDAPVTDSYMTGKRPIAGWHL